MKYNFNNKNKENNEKLCTSKYRRSLSNTSINKTRRRKWSDKYKNQLIVVVQRDFLKNNIVNMDVNNSLI